ncbi:hypothetical protein QL285_021072 [Trifolium repens]|jgi:hypothetical protein|nr:hypothetical protein QL285_021072 [Trifolium repens]
MARKNSKRSTVANLKTQKGRKKTEGSTSQTVRVQDPKKVKPKNLPLPQDSSSSDDIDGDYAEFLKTYRPQEFTLMMRFHKILQVLTTWMRTMQSF